MAGLGGAGMTEVPMPTAMQQLAAIRYVRGRLFWNAFRRKGGKGEIVARILLFPLFAVLALGPIVGAGFISYAMFSGGMKVSYYPWVLWAVFLIWQSLSISTKAVAPSFDLGMLIRFPLRFSTYLLIRLLFGLLDTPTVVCSLALLSSAVGIGVARPALFLPAAGVLLLLDVTILLFFRMIFLWFDRFFAQRKTREILIGLFFVLMLGFQYVNITVNGGGNRHATPAERAKHAQRMAFAKSMLHSIEPVLHALPPGLAATAITDFSEGQADKAFKPMLVLCLFGAGFLRLFARRLKGEFHGESFSETAARSAEPVASAASVGPAPTLDVPVAVASEAKGGVLSPIILACIGKELRYLTRSGPLLLALISPIFMVFILVTRSGMGRHPGDWLLPSTLAYIMLGLTASMYNILGTDGPGIHLYLLAPIRFRDVVLAKNIVGLTLVGIELAIASAIVLSTAAVPALPVLVATYLWLVFALMVNLTMGNIRSIYSPSLVDLGKFRQGKQGQLNALIGIAVLLLALGLGAGVLFLANHVHLPWLTAGVFGALAAMAVGFYVLNLNHLEQIALDRREIITGELCKT
jgi:ABC-2 type transport system permease protein